MALPSLATIGSFASGLGSLASGLGIGSKGPSNKDMYESIKAPYNVQMKYGPKLFDQNMDNYKRHGLHPLLAAGAQPWQPGGVSFQSRESGFDPAQMGQGVDRALNAGKSAVQRELDSLELERAKLSNDYLRTQIAGAAKAIASSGEPPPYDSGVGGYFIDGQRGSGGSLIESQPARPTIPSKSGPSLEPGSITNIGYVRTSPTTLEIVPSKDMKERMEDDIFQQIKFHSRHSLPIVRDINHLIRKPPYPSDTPLPKGYKKWVFYQGKWHAKK